MAQKTIPELDAITALDSNTIFPVDSGVETFKATMAQVGDGVMKNATSNLFVGVYDATRSYSIADAVSYLGVVYVSLTNTNVNHTPLSDLTNWRLATRSIIGQSSSPTAVGTTTAIAHSADDNVAYLRGKNTGFVALSGLVQAYFSQAYSPTLSLWVMPSNDASGKVATSTDGVTWTEHASAIEANDWTCIRWFDELEIFVALAQSGTHRVAVSSDGLTWTAHSASSALGWNDVIFIPSTQTLVAVAVGGSNPIMTSTDSGATWTGHSSGALTPTGAITYSKKQGLVIMGITGGIAYSTDGFTLTSVNLPNSYDGGSVVYCEDLDLWVVGSFSAANSGDANIFYSRDGRNWFSSDLLNSKVNGIVYSKTLKLFIAMGSNMSTPFPYSISRNGRNWSTPNATMNVGAFTPFNMVYPDNVGFMAAGNFSWLLSKITATPQIVAGTYPGQTKKLIGCDALNGVAIPNGNGVSCIDTFVVSATKVQEIVWDAAGSVWIKI